jgi:hypothetical protein
MNMEIALDLEDSQESGKSLLLARLRVAIKRVAVTLVLLAVLLAAWLVRVQEPYASNSDSAYFLGLVGGSLMLALLLYPLRKRLRWMQRIGPLRIWFRFHMFAGVLGPMLILFHSTFQVRSINAAVALTSMLLVAASGLVGRFFYRRIHRGLYGSRATQAELQVLLDNQLKSMRSSSLLPQAVLEEVENFARLVSHVPEGRWRRIVHFVTLGVRRRFAGRRARLALTLHTKSNHKDFINDLADMDELLRNINATLIAAQSAAQFLTYERLFSHWHTVHIPFLFMLLLTALVHVVAVHAY